LLVQAVWQDNANLPSFDAPKALSLPVSSKPIEKAVTYLNDRRFAWTLLVTILIGTAPS